jgi:hypothetical protein
VNRPRISRYMDSVQSTPERQNLHLSDTGRLRFPIARCGSALSYGS